MDAKSAFAHWLGVAKETLPELSEDDLKPIESALYRAPHADARAQEKFETPWLDRYYTDLSSRLGLSPKPFWPGGASFALCLTHDIDRVLSTIQRAKKLWKHPLTAAKALAWDTATAFVHKEKNPYYNFQEAMDWQAEWQVPLTCYVLFEKRRWKRAFTRLELQHVWGVYDPAMIKESLLKFKEAGNEIGIHSSFTSWSDPAALSRERETLESWGLGPVTGVRSHYLNFSSKTPDHCHQAGMSYDSTMGFNFHNGFRCGTSFPFPWNGVWEVPFQLMDSALRQQESTASGRLARAMRCLEAVHGSQGVLTLNFHLQMINPSMFPEEIAILEALLSRAKALGAWLTTPQQVVTHWVNRLSQSPSQDRI